MKRTIFILILLFAVLMCRTPPAEGQHRPWQSYYSNNRGSLGSGGYNDAFFNIFGDLDDLVASYGTADTGGTVYYVDNNAGNDNNDGLSWDTPKLTIAAAMALSHADIALTNKGANRNRIYVKGDDYAEDWTKLARKTDIIGVGSDDGSKRPRILGQHSIEAQSTADYMGCRFINMYFQGNTADTGALFTIPSAQNGIEFIGCRFMPVAGGQTIGLNATTCHDLKVIGCTFDRAAIGNEGFTSAAINIATGSIYYLEIIGNRIESGIGIVINASTIPTGGIIRNNVITAATLTIDDNSNKFYIANNTLISDTTMSGGYDFDNTFAVNNVLTGSDGQVFLPPDSTLAGLVTTVGTLSQFIGTVSDTGTTGSTICLPLAGYTDDFFNDAWVLVVDLDVTGASTGEIVDITDYDDGLGTFSHSALSEALVSGDLIHIDRKEAMLVGDSITASSIADDAISAEHLNTGAITADAFAADSIVAGTFATGAISADAFLADALIAATINTGAFTADAFAADALVAATFATGAFTADAFAADALIAGTFATGAFTADAFAADALVAATFATDSISADALADDTIDAGSIATDAIGAAEIQTDAITAAEIAADAIGASEIATDAIDADALAADALAEIEAEATDALEAELLNKLSAEATADTDDPVDIVVTEVADDSVLAQIMTMDGDASSFERLTDSLEALGINLRTILGSAGEVWYVDDAGADTTYASAGTGKSWSKPFDTIDYALSQATEDDGAVILVRPGHTTTLGATQESYADGGITVIGMGTGEDMSKIVFNDATSEIDITANVTLINMWFQSTTIDTTIGLDIEDTADGASIIGCLFTNASGFEFLTAIDVKGGADRITLENNTIINTGGADAVSGIASTDGASDRLKIIGNYVYGKYDSACIHSSQIDTLAIVKDNIAHNMESGDMAIEFATTATGTMTGNKCYADSFSNMYDFGSMIPSDNWGATSVSTAAVPIPGRNPDAALDGKAWYVDNLDGASTNNGQSWDTAITSIEAAVALADDFDTIYIKGGIYTNYTETVDTIGQDKPGLKFIGIGEGIMCPAWQSEAVGEHALIIDSSNIEVRNIRFNGASKTVAFIEVETETATRGDASVIVDCYFDGENSSHSAIEYSGGSLRNRLINCRIQKFTMANAGLEAAVWGSAFVQSAIDYDIRGNLFADNTDHLILPLLRSRVIDNVFMKAGYTTTATQVLNTYYSGSCGANIITGNVFSQDTFELTEANGYTGSATDNWAGNYCPDGMTSEKVPGAGTALIDIENRLNRPYLCSSVTGEMDSTNYGAAADPTIFTVTGDIMCRAHAFVEENVSSDSTDTLELGITGNTAILLVQDAMDGSAFRAGDTWTLNVAADDPYAAMSPDDWIIIGAGADIVLTINDNDCAAGKIRFNLEWYPMSADANVVGAAP